MRTLWTAVLTLFVLAGCDGPSSLIAVAPSPIAPAPTSPQPLGGEIRLVTVTHPAGRTLLLEECGPSWTGIRGTHLCNDEWRGTFEVLLDDDLTNAIVTVSFFDGDERCGLIYVPDHTFAAGRERLVSTSTAIYFTYEPEGYDSPALVQRCEVPRTTTRLVVEVWGAAYRAAPLLRRDFVYGYTFVRR
jgi:hypothetical protein